MDEITIRGTMSDFTMTIILNNALPNFSMAEFRKMLKIIKEDFEHRDDLIKTVDEWISNRLADIPDLKKKKAVEYDHFYQAVKDLERKRDEIKEEIKNKRTRTFTPLSKDQIKAKRQDIKDIGSELTLERECRSDALRDFKSLEREEKKLKPESEVIKEMIEHEKGS